MMTNTVKENAINAIVEGLGGKTAKAIVDLGIAIVKVIKNQRQLRQEKLRILLTPEVDINFAYNEVLLTNFVNRHVALYNPSKPTSLKLIAKEISRQKIARNVIIRLHATSK